MNALDKLQAVMFKWTDRAAVIKPKLDCKEIDTGIHWWRVQIVEEIDNTACKLETFFKWEDYINWADGKLKDWPDCKRMAYDMWDFKHRQDAEKFITLYHLSWAQ